jgi:hypothetical protein
VQGFRVANRATDKANESGRTVGTPSALIVTLAAMTACTLTLTLSGLADARAKGNRIGQRNFMQRSCVHAFTSHLPSCVCTLLCDLPLALDPRDQHLQMLLRVEVNPKPEGL